jgi:hypothetical protein
MDPDTAIFVIDLQDGCQQKTNLKKKFFSLLLFEGAFNFISSSKIKSQKKSQSSRNQGFFLIFLLSDRRIRSHTSD